MSKKGRRRSVSMRDFEYIAFDLYAKFLTKASDVDHSITSTLRGVFMGKIPPVPQKYFDMGMELALKDRAEKEKEDASPEEPDLDDGRVGGGIFTF